MKLFAVYVGGEAKGAHIELHDMRFVVGESIEDTYAEVKRQWWGIPKSLHLDCWAELNQVSGYRVALKREPTDSPLKLYYINVGGYAADQFIELHQNVFVAAESEQKAKVKALKRVRHWQSFHRDDMYEAEQCFDLATMAPGWFLHLTPDETAGDPAFSCRYVKLG